MRPKLIHVFAQQSPHLILVGAVFEHKAGTGYGIALCGLRDPNVPASAKQRPSIRSSRFYCPSPVSVQKDPPVVETAPPPQT